MSLVALSPSSASFSSSSTGADLWEIPTTRTLMDVLASLRAPMRHVTRCTGRFARCARSRDPLGPGRHRLALLVVGQDLELDGEVDLAYVDAVRHRQDARCE